MKSFRRKIIYLILYGLLVSVVFISCFAAYPALTGRQEQKPASYNGILRLWQIDNFEGGKGSRASFLNRAAKVFERQCEGTFVLVTSHTVQSAKTSVAEGNIPDMVSYGVGADFAGDIAIPLENYSFPYASIGGKAYAYPWCRGGYFLFSADGDFSELAAENTVISQGGSLSEVAAFCAGLAGECNFESSVKAYVSFINGKYKYMLGTQRDVFRLITRQVAFYAKPFDGFSDLWQYISICTDDVKKYNACLDFLNCLLTEEVQALLPQIGMMSADFMVYDSSVPAMADGERLSAKKSVSAFLSSAALEELRTAARLALSGDKINAKNLQNYLI